MKNFTTIQIDHKDSIFNIILNRPEKHNAFNNVMIAELTEVFQSLTSEQDIRLVVLKGNGKSFCAGADLNYMKGIAKFGFDENYQDGKRLAALFQSIYQCKKPTLAMVHGACFGGANGLIAACDIVLADENTKFAFSEVKLGISPATIGPFVLKRMGEFKGKEFMMTGRRFDGVEAENAGLVNKAVALEELENVLHKYIIEFMSAAPGAVAATREMINKIYSGEESDITDYTAKLIASLRESEEGQEGMASFLEKRKANWNK